MSHLHLDDIDWQLIKLLAEDGRTTFKALGDAIGFTGLGAKKRYEKLHDNGIIKVAPLINVEKLNLRLAMIFMETESAEAVRRILTRFKNCPRVLNFFSTLSGYNLIVLTMAEDQTTLECEAMGKCSLRSGDAIRRSEFYPLGGIEYFPFVPLRTSTTPLSDATPCGVDCRDCVGFQTQKCLGCPSTQYYRGLIQPSIAE